MTILQPNHILKQTPHNIRDSRKAKKRLNKLLEFLEPLPEVSPERSPEIESIIRKARAVIKAKKVAI